jgi:hypothetical protein
MQKNIYNLSPSTVSTMWKKQRSDFICTIKQPHYKQENEEM